MTRNAMIILMAMLLAVPVMADQPATGYWLVEVASLTNDVNLVGSLAKVDPSTLDDKAECHGYFVGACDLWVNAKTLQFRMKAHETGGALTYSVSLSWPHVKRVPVQTNGEIVVSDMFTAKDGWQQEKYVLVLKKLNLLK